MNTILEVLRDNEPLTTQLRSATSKESAYGMIVDAAGKRGKKVGTKEVEEYFANRPKAKPEELSDEELEAVSGGMMVCSIKQSEICCYTCRTSQIIW